MKVQDVGTVVKVSDFVRKSGDVYYLVLVDGVNSAWKVYSRREFQIGDKVIVFEKLGRIYIVLLEDWR